MTQPRKDKKKQFVLPSALKSIRQHQQHETQQFIKGLHVEPSGDKQRKQHKYHSLFKLNPASSAIISEVPVDSLRKRSKSQQMESLKKEQQEAFSLLEHKQQTELKSTKERIKNLTKYDIDLRQIGVEQNLAPQPVEQQSPSQEEKYQLVRPSKVYSLNKQPEDSVFQPTIFQTPILPCFASEFQKKMEDSKRIQEGQGLWRVGKMRVKAGKVQLRIGQFVFEGGQVPAEGRAGVVSGPSLLSLPGWRQLCILQPHDTLLM